MLSVCVCVCVGWCICMCGGQKAARTEDTLATKRHMTEALNE